MNTYLAYVSYKELGTNHVRIHVYEIETVYERLNLDLPWIGIKVLIYT